MIVLAILGCGVVFSSGVLLAACMAAAGRADRAIEEYQPAETLKWPRPLEWAA